MYFSIVENPHRQRFNKNNATNANVRGSGSAHTASTSNIPDRDIRPKTSAALNDFHLVGDDFLLALASIDLGCVVSNRKSISTIRHTMDFSFIHLGFGLILFDLLLI